jgi:hypothetical protein
MKYVDAMHMYTARKIARKTSVKTLNLKGEMYFATETSLLPGAKLMFSSLWSTAWSKAKPAGVGGGL